MDDSQIVIEDEMRAREKEMGELKSRLEDLMATEPDIDDLFLLRYLLSYRNIVAQAEEAIRFACQYRQENASWLRSAREGDRTKGPKFEILRNHIAGGIHKTTIHGAPFFIFRGGFTDTSRLMNTFTHEEMCQIFIYDKEVTFWECDRVSREKGRLVKMLGVSDATNISFLRMDKRFFSAMGDSSKYSDKLHPQLIERIVVINAGSAFKFMYHVAKMFMSKRTFEHLSVCTGFDRSVGASTCPYASRWVNLDDLPTFAGGNCNCEGGCLPDIPNEMVGYKISLMEKSEGSGKKK